MSAPLSSATVNTLLNRLIDRGYSRIADPVIRAILRNGMTGALEARLKALAAEADRLTKAGEVFASDNPVFKALLSEVDDAMKVNTALLNGIAPQLQASGADAGATIARQLALPGLSDGILKSIGIEWFRVDPETLARLVDYSNRPAWRALLAGYQAGVGTAAQQLFLRGVIAGQNPVAIARDLRDLVQGLPASQAQTLARTLQLQSYRAATAANYAANSDILEPEGVRIETLDDRICIACIDLHGTPAPIDVPLDEHWNGRGVVVPVVKGRPAPDVQTGAAWFDGLSVEKQASYMSGAAFAAYQSGDVQLSDFVERHTDETFGGMIREASLKGILGQEKASQYYG